MPRRASHALALVSALALSCSPVTVRIDGGDEDDAASAEGGARVDAPPAPDVVLPGPDADPPAPDADVPGPDADVPGPDAVAPGPDAEPPPDDVVAIDVRPPRDVVTPDVVVALDVQPPRDVVTADAPRDVVATDVRPDVVAMDVQPDVRPDVLAMDVQPDVRPDVVAMDVQPDVPVTAPVVFPAHHASLRTAQVWATIAEGPPSITVRWANVTGRTVSAVSISRKPLSSLTWGTPIATPAASTNQYTDTAVTPGTIYEYRVQLTTSSGTAYGYVASGIAVQTDGYQGRVALVVDQSQQSALAAELATLENDLYGDGWIPVTIPVMRNATPASVRTSLANLYMANPDLRAAYLIGHVPVAYAGNNNPDGHGSGRVMGADGYYGELTSSWNGSSGCVNAPQQATLLDPPGPSNTFCNGDFPSTLELEVGRVDMASLPSYMLSETALLRGYLQRAHDYKIAARRPTIRAFIRDGLGEAGYGTGLNGWATFAGLVGPANITVDNGSSTFLYNILNNQNHVFVAGSYYGGTCNGSANGVVGSTPTVAGRNWGGVFNTSIGSYYGELNCQDGFLRGLLASGDALSNAYNALHWYNHPMAMGQTLGFCARRTMNNKLTNTYQAVSAGVASTANTHLGLMGDPTLRMQYITPPGTLTLSNASGRVRASWLASSEPGLAGYHVYQVTATGFTRLTSAPTAMTSFTTDVTYAAGMRFVVRAIKRVTTAGGSYDLPSVGAVARTP